MGKNVRTMVLYLFSLCLLPLIFDSCWAINRGRGWIYPCHDYGPKDLIKYKETDIHFDIDLRRRQLGFPIPPFFWFYFDISKNYFIGISFHTGNVHYNRIDSVKYNVLNLKDSLLFQGLIKCRDKGIFKQYHASQAQIHGYPPFFTTKIKKGHLDLSGFKDFKNFKMTMIIYGIQDSSKPFISMINSIPLSSVKGFYYDGAD